MCGALIISAGKQTWENGIQSVIYKPYCIVDGLKMYGTEYALDFDKLNFPAPANDGVRGIAEKRAKY